MGNFCSFVRKMMSKFHDFLLNAIQAKSITLLYQENLLLIGFVIPFHKIPGDPKIFLQRKIKMQQRFLRKSLQFVQFRTKFFHLFEHLFHRKYYTVHKNLHNTVQMELSSTWFNRLQEISCVLNSILFSFSNIYIVTLGKPFFFTF